MSVLHEVAPHALSLEQWLHKSIGHEAWMEGNAKMQSLLQQTFVARRAHLKAPDAAVGYSRDVTMTQTDIVESVISTLLQRKRYGKDKSTNLLALGYGVASPGSNNHFLRNDMTCYHPNTLVAKLKSNEWVQLHSHLGDDVMKDILLNHNVFVRMESTTDCYIQLAGDNVRFAVRSPTSADSSINIRRVMFAQGHAKQVSFQSTHVLAPPVPSTLAARRVVASILCLKSTKRLDRRCQKLVPIVLDMMARFKQCDIGGSVRRLCPIPSECKAILSTCRRDRSTTERRPALETPWTTKDVELEDEGFASQDDCSTSANSRKRKRSLVADSSKPAKCANRLSCQATIADLLQFSTPKDNVYECVRFVLDAVLPKQLWGCSKNHTCFLQLVRTYLFSHMHDVHGLNGAVNAMAVTRIPWMQLHARSKCVPTEATKRKRMLLLIVSWIWSDLIDPMLRNYFYMTTTEGHFNHVVYYRHSVWTAIAGLGKVELAHGHLQPVATVPKSKTISTIRFQPKPHGVRPIVNLSRKPHGGVSINRTLRLVHHVLRHECTMATLGATVANMNDIRAKLDLFRARWAAANNPPLYFVTVDIARCFDTIRSRRLLKMLPRLLTQDRYMVRRHYLVQSTKAGVRYKTCTAVLVPSELTRFEQLAASAASKHSVHIDGVVYDYVHRRDLLKLVEDHLCANYVSIESDLFLQKEGIPQGSVLSSLLCNIYYADFEKNVLRPRIPVVAGQDLLLRYTDDFLLLTSNRQNAIKFEAIMHRGTKKYGCHVNPRKTQTNLHDASQVLHWCGLTIDPATLAVHSNYAKYTASPGSLRNTMFLDTIRPLHAWLFQHLFAAVQFRCHPIHFAAQSPHTCQVNMYHIMAVVAAKLAYILRCLPKRNRRWNVEFLHRGLLQLWRKLFDRIRQACPTAMTWTEVRGMGLHAAIHAWTKQNTMAPLVGRFTSDWTALPPAVRGLTDELATTPMSAFIQEL
ncbi:hypothetical protein H310_13066 [Aphanomyces invadans]|uniref:Telomerase reverse transcriptase n=1 Tax=Aphanomyces invadans TaxID=157072 RepID=A0A024TGY1_9STRA|nr:hypothetical protein H310_13066 [Aphanomyces invadans]ETV92612.1 hypothetical protein H310_13066 [Aphanomyces invadans]|eukprot:XP_008878648.1 hypothetical protein H310_13066 [Aphanomyces invadans]